MAFENRLEGDRVWLGEDPEVEGSVVSSGDWKGIESGGNKKHKWNEVFRYQNIQDFVTSKVFSLKSIFLPLSYVFQRFGGI